MIPRIPKYTLSPKRRTNIGKVLQVCHKFAEVANINSMQFACFDEDITTEMLMLPNHCRAKA